ncbi:uncharacterized protein LOC18020044 isoform X2 [Eutrema salsugineum]|uniref:uncharacterized protein LOC18020044 isoform X2 n=1 Tax=Eutrema salsugineum TaxID=72664 RepID=UPI000CED00CF|nr:uncharacterized protein LOC18020044 isoform X2 [Eutrema salsugineum]
MGFAITVILPNCGSKFLPKRSFRDKSAFSLAICLEFCSLCHFLHPAQPLSVRHQRRMSWTTIRSSVGGGRFDPPSGSSGQTGDWDVLSAALAVIVVECIGALMYRASVPLINKMRSIITMFNYWKTGLALGLFLDSFKF